MTFPSVGSRRKNNTCTFTVWAPLKEKVELVLEGDQVYRMTKDDWGYWTVDVEGPARPYWFRLDGAEKLPDPASRAQPEGVHGPSVLVPEDYAWSDHDWIGLSLGDMVIYEIHVGTFTDSGDFDGVVSRLSYLRSLGINTLELMPVAQFPGTRNWGYDGVYPFAVQNSYGGAEGLKKLVNAAHLSGMAVILDVVYNHLGPEGNYLGEYGPYFTEKYKTGWGKAINFDDAWCDGVRHFYWQNALMWLDEFHLDGLRLDAVHAIWDSGANHFVEVLSEKVRALEQRVGRKKVLIAEFDLNNPRYIQPKQKGGFDLDGQWIDEFHHALLSLVSGETDGYYEDFGTIDHLVRAFRDGYVYTGQYSPHRKKMFGRMPVGTTCDQFVVFSQNHDQIGNRMLGDRPASRLKPEALRLMAAACILSPYVPMLFMGEEYAEKHPFQYFVSHGDDKLVEAVRKGRKEEFSHFQWRGDIPDPQSPKTFEQCVLSWAVDSDREAAEMFRFYQQLIDFRKSRAAMQGKTGDAFRVVSSGDIICLERNFNDDHLVILFNFGTEPQSFAPAQKRRMRTVFGGDASGGNAIDVGTVIDVAPLSFSIFESFDR